MISNSDYVEMFAESLFSGDSGRTIFESPVSSDENISLGRIVCILSEVIERKEKVGSKIINIAGRPTSASAISIVAAMCLGVRASIFSEEVSSEKESLSSVVINILETSSNDYQYTDEMLEGCKSVFLENAPKFELELQTSGTTGTSNKVLINAQGICYQAVEVAKAIELKETDRQLMYMPFNYVYGLSVLMSGLYSRSLLVESEFNMEQPKSFFDQLPEKGITVFSGVPYVYNMISKRWGIKNLSGGNLRILTQAGGLLGEDIKTEILDLDGGFDFWVMYGQTEFGGRISQVNLSKNRAMIKSTGLPLDGISAEVVNEAGEVTENIEGEIFVHSKSVAVNIDDLTKSIEHEGSTYYSTGDIGYLKDGYIHVTGRNKNFIKVAGKRVNLASIEKEFKSVPVVIDCVVEFVENRFPLFLIGVISEGFEECGSQPELKAYLNSLFEAENYIKNMLNGVPFYAYVIHGSPPRLPSNKLDVSKLKEILKESYNEKRPVHIRV